MSDSVPKFRVTANSRFPVISSSQYDDITHRYLPDYVNPSSYRLTVNAFPDTEVIIKKPSKPGFGLEAPEQGGPVEKSRLIVPPGTVAVVYSIKGEGFSNSKSNPVGSLVFSLDQPLLNSPWEWQVVVPRTGTYDISVKLRNESGGGPESNKRFVVRDFLIVSIGDSAASGQGNPDVPGKPKGFDPDIDWWEVVVPFLPEIKILKAAAEVMGDFLKRQFTTFAASARATINMEPEPVWQEKNAYRSLNSGTALGARKLENISQGRLITFLSFARTGSEIRAGLIGSRTKGDNWIGNIGQIKEAKNTLGNRPIDALLISIGVNDVNLVDRITDLVADDNPLLGLLNQANPGGNDEEARKRVESMIEQRIAQLPAAFVALEQELSTLNIRQIYLTEYPIGLFDRENFLPDKGCEIFSTEFFDADIDKLDAELLKSKGERLNAVLRNEAEKRGWFFVSGIADGFEGRGYCTSENVRCFVRAEESLILQGDMEGTLHPNAKGHAIIQDRIAHALERHLLTPQENWLEPVLHVMMS